MKNKFMKLLTQLQVHMHNPASENIKGQALLYLFTFSLFQTYSCLQTSVTCWDVSSYTLGQTKINQ
jgi:hypothetical protein